MGIRQIRHSNGGKQEGEISVDPYGGRTEASTSRGVGVAVKWTGLELKRPGL